MSDRPVVLVTGGNRGIGRAIVEVLAPDWRVLVGGTNAARVNEVATSLPDADGFVADLADEDSTARAVQGMGRLDALVHSAGLVAHGSVEQSSRQQWREVLELNVIAVADLTRTLLPRLRERSGQVVVINSGAGFVSRPGNSVYAASKFAVRAFTDALREEERGRIRVTSIHPGRVDTDMQHELLASEGRSYDPGVLLRPESVARAVKFALEADSDAGVESLEIRPARN